jgi:hydrogenase-4 component F
LGNNAPGDASYLPLLGHLALVLAAGIYLPAALVHWFQTIATLLG